jgi:H+/Cl- antiporter ClcA
MSTFSVYFGLGRDHIADINGIDHILFIVALCVRYQLSDWKKLLILITAFTIGHSITLALSVFNFVSISTEWIEFLIPVTIILTAFSNFFVKKFQFREKFPLIYYLALFFGLIHGLGFSNYLKSLLGQSNNIVTELLAFNLGLEIGQLLIVACLLLTTFIATQLFSLNRREVMLFLSGAAMGLALQMCIERIPF